MWRKGKGGKKTGVRYMRERKLKFRNEAEGKTGVKSYKGEEEDEKNRKKLGV